MEMQPRDTTTESRKPLTVGEAAQAYQALNSLDPGALGKDLTNRVVEIADILEEVVVPFQRKVQKHRERLSGEDDELSEEAEEEFQETVDELGEEEVGMRPILDPSDAPSVRAMRELMSIDPLKPILPHSHE